MIKLKPQIKMLLQGFWPFELYDILEMLYAAIMNTDTICS